jgi:hypothetical protein
MEQQTLQTEIPVQRDRAAGAGGGHGPRTPACPAPPRPSGPPILHRRPRRSGLAAGPPHHPWRTVREAAPSAPAPPPTHCCACCVGTARRERSTPSSSRCRCPHPSLAADRNPYEQSRPPVMCQRARSSDHTRHLSRPATSTAASGTGTAASGLLAAKLSPAPLHRCTAPP